MPNSSLALPSPLSSWKETLDYRLNALVGDLDAPPSLLTTLRDHVTSGKRLRPLLLLATVEGLGGSWSSALEVACALEFAYLAGIAPPTPHSDEERGTSTVGCIEETFHFAKLSLITLAFDVLSHQDHLSTPLRLGLIQRLARLSGAAGALSGQVLEQSQEEPLTPPALWELHRRKTGMHLRAAMEMGALIAQSSQNSLKKLGGVGEELGIAYQLIEDFLQTEPSTRGTAKSKGRTALAKSSAVKTLGAALTRTQALQLLARSKELLAEELRYPETATLLAERMVHRFH